MRLVRAQLGCAQMGNAVRDQCHSERHSVENRIMWVVAACVGAHLGSALQRVALVYRRAKSGAQQGTNRVYHPEQPYAQPLFLFPNSCR